MYSRDKASADCNSWPDNRICVTVESDDFRGVVALSLATAQSLLDDLQSCIEDVQGRDVK